MICSGYANFDQIVIKQRRGRVRIMGLGFTNEVVRPIAGMGQVHSDNVVGDPASLSDCRLKLNQVIVPITRLTNIFNAIETKEYDLIQPGTDIDGNALPTTKRVGFIADEVKAALASEDWSNIVGDRPVGEDAMLTLDYSRLVVVLWGAVKGLSARLTALEG